MPSAGLFTETWNDTETIFVSIHTKKDWQFHQVELPVRLLY